MKIKLTIEEIQGFLSAVWDDDCSIERAIQMCIDVYGEKNRQLILKAMQGYNASMDTKD